jgi:hypothetical protein
VEQKGQLILTYLDHVAISERRARDALAVDERPALAQVVLDIPCLRFFVPSDAGVAFANGFIVDADRALRVAADPGS